MGLEAREGSEGASPEVLEVSHLVDLEVGLEVDHLGDPKGDDPVVQVIDSHHLGRQEVAPEEGGCKLDNL